MKRSRLSVVLPHWSNAALALVAAILLVLAFPDFEYWFTAWFALVPLMWAIEREKSSVIRAFVTGWIFGTAFFFGTCWWLAYAPIHYAAFPPLLAYSLIFIATMITGIFPAIFAAVFVVLLRRFGTLAFLAAPFVWVSTEFLRYWLTGNNWNSIGYSQFNSTKLLPYSSVGGVLLVAFFVAAWNVPTLFIVRLIVQVSKWWIRVLASDYRGKRPVIGSIPFSDEGFRLNLSNVTWSLLGMLLLGQSVTFLMPATSGKSIDTPGYVIAIQPNVPMSGLDSRKLEQLRQRQIDLAEIEIQKLTTDHRPPTTVILPESPMNFMYNDDRGFQHFIGDFARRNNVSVLFNSAEPDKTNGKYFNSAVMVGAEGREVGEYDKIYLLPFGEAVPPFLEGIVPGFVGNFSYGRNYDLLPVGDAKAGVMICFESHFGQLSRHYAANGADVIIEMTNDGYLGPTPVLRQHLANAVFRAVETNRPVLRVTNVGVTAYINEHGQVIDPLPVYAEGTRTWSVSKSDGSQTFYVRFGDWFAWLCTAVTVILLGFILIRKKPTPISAE